MNEPIVRPVQAGDYILITFGERGGTISFFCISGDGEYYKVTPKKQPTYSHNCKSAGATMRYVYIIAFVIGCTPVEVQGWSPKPPPNFKEDQTIVFRLEPCLTE